MGTARYYVLANAMLAANLAANFLGRRAARFLGQRLIPDTATSMPHAAAIGGLVLLMFAVFFTALVVCVYCYERPIRAALAGLRPGRVVSPAELQAARRRALNEPYAVVGVNLVTWVVHATAFGGAMWLDGVNSPVVLGVALESLFTGLVTATFAFFLLEHFLQHRLAPVLFPDGRLSDVAGVWRIRIGTRVAALVFACSIVPLVAVHFTIHGSRVQLALGDTPPGTVLERLQTTVLAETTVFIAFAVGLTAVVVATFTRSLRDITAVVARVRHGVFTVAVRVTTNDEIGYTGDAINEMTAGLRERERIVEVFGRYVSREVRDEILAGRISGDGERKDVTVLFADLRDFTPLTERHDPKLVVKLLNTYFTAMTGAIERHGGFVLQFIGDEVYAVFGAPVPRPDHAARAVAAGQEMIRRLDQLNLDLAARGWPPLDHGIALHTGEVLAASLGSAERASYLLVGDTVNLAARLQSMTREAGVQMIVSAATVARLPEPVLGAIKLRRLPVALVKGRREPVEAFAVE
jgi:adenylate cyclase